MNRTEMIYQIQKNIAFSEMIKDELLTSGNFQLLGLFTLSVLKQGKRKYYDTFHNRFFESVPKKRLKVKTGTTLKSLLNAGADNSV